MKNIKIICLCSIVFCLTTVMLTACGTTSVKSQAPADAYYQYEPITLTFDGPSADELDDPNPFMDYRMDVIFSHDGEEFVVPGFFAADGDAANTGASSGNKWRVRFAANKPGDWWYQVSFRQGSKVAIADDPKAGQPVDLLDGKTGRFEVFPVLEDSPYARGRLEYVGEHYLQFSESEEYLIKLGTDSPENFLAFEDFDATPNVGDRRKSWSPHAKDYSGDAKKHLWGKSKGKAIFGAIDYLASENLNAFSFLTFNPDGDDRNVFPQLLKVSHQEYETYANDKQNLDAWHTMFYKTRFDVSKLAQWERVFTYGSEKGFFLHFKTHEMETDHVMDHGVFGDEYKIYYRELIARFAHHPVSNWNIGEEANTNAELQRATAAYIRKLSPYKKQHIVMHTIPTQDDRYADLVGDQSVLTGASLQLKRSDFTDVYDRVIKWYTKSAEAGKPWALAVDEPGNGKWALLTDDQDPNHDKARVRVLWAALLGGAYGVEWYFSYLSPNNDLNAEDYRSRDLFWDQNSIARNFFNQYVPFASMKPMPESDSSKEFYVFGAPGDTYVIMIGNPTMYSTASLDTLGQTYKVQWFNPRKGGDLQTGDIAQVTSGEAPVDLGSPPSEQWKDWVVLLTAVD